MLLFSVISAYISGKFFRSNIFSWILDKLNIYDTGNKYLWDDIMGKEPIKAIIEYKSKIYEGYVHLFESYNNSPQVVLGAYIIYDFQHKILEDHRNDNHSVVILDSSKAESIQIIYSDDDSICKEIKMLCETAQNT